MSSPAAILRAHPLAPEPVGSPGEWHPLIRYRAGYKYQLAADFRADVRVPGSFARVPFAHLDADGALTIRKGYAWDGPSGPTFDTRNTLRASLVHDVIYQMIRTGELPREWKKVADDLFHRMLLEDGMCRVRAWLYWRAVRRCADGATRPSSERPVLSAP